MSPTTAPGKASGRTAGAINQEQNLSKQADMKSPALRISGRGCQHPSPERPQWQA